MSTTADVSAPPSYAAGLRSLEDEILVDALPVSGELPAWLSGSLLRTGPAKFEAGTQSYRHWFDGLAMLHRFTFGDGAVSYGNRFLQGRTERAVRGEGRIAYPEFATDPCRKMFGRVQTLFRGGPEFGDSANINVVKLGTTSGYADAHGRVLVDADDALLAAPFLIWFGWMSWVVALAAAATPVIALALLVIGARRRRSFPRPADRQA